MKDLFVVNFFLGFTAVCFLLFTLALAYHDIIGVKYSFTLKEGFHELHVDGDELELSFNEKTNELICSNGYSINLVDLIKEEENTVTIPEGHSFYSYEDLGNGLSLIHI